MDLGNPPQRMFPYLDSLSVFNKGKGGNNRIVNGVSMP